MLTVLKSNNSKKALVCVPYGGGEPQIFLSMCEYIKDFDVLGVYTSFFNKDINIGENIGKELCKLGYSSFSVIGICVGSVVALEIAKYLESNRKVVDNVFIGASLPTKAPRILGKTINPWSFVNRKYINYFLEKLGGEVIGVACIANRTSKDIGMPIYSAIKLDIQVHDADECPLCKEGNIELVKPGSREFKELGM